MSRCWKLNPGERPSFNEIINFFTNNTRTLSPCLDVPSASVVMTEDGDMTPHFRKMSGPVRNPGSGNVRVRNTSPVDSLPRYQTSPSNTYPLNHGTDVSITDNEVHKTASHLLNRAPNVENGNGPVMEPLLPLTRDSYVTRYALIQRTRSPDAASIERSPSDMSSR